MCTNERKRAQMCNLRHAAPNFAVKNEAHGTETNRKEGGTPMGGENRE